MSSKPTLTSEFEASLSDIAFYVTVSKKKKTRGWHTPIILALGRLRQEVGKF
jgi:hypothetical protein